MINGIAAPISCNLEEQLSSPDSRNAWVTAVYLQVLPSPKCYICEGNTECLPCPPTLPITYSPWTLETTKSADNRKETDVTLGKCGKNLEIFYEPNHIEFCLSNEI